MSLFQSKIAIRKERGNNNLSVLLSNSKNKVSTNLTEENADRQLITDVEKGKKSNEFF
jgi:hypothetical protein